jgi:hypothetical protein
LAMVSCWFVANDAASARAALSPAKRAAVYIHRAGDGQGDVGH